MDTARKTPGKFIEYLLLRTVNFSLSLIPFRVRAWLMEGVGLALFFLLGRYRRLILGHLTLAFPEQSDAWRGQVARQNCRNMGRLFAEFVQTPRITANFARRWMRLEPDTDAHRAIFANAAIAVLGHLGNWEWHGFLGGYVAGRPVDTLVKRHTNYWSNAYAERTRHRAHMRLIYVDENPFKIIKRLRAGSFVAFTSDQDARGHGEFFDFFGKPASTFLGPAIVARNAKDVPVYLVWSHRDERKRLVFEYERLALPDHLDRNAQMDEWEREFTRRWVAALEEKIRRYPADYLWAHNRWKTRPPGDPREVTAPAISSASGESAGGSGPRSD